MNKKLFSAALFGALLLGTASTFVSCKDYDDDIQNLQTQVNDVKSALAALDAKVAAGKWVSSLTSVSGGFTVTFSDGSTYTITNGATGATGATGENGKDGKDGSTVEVKDGVWVIDGETTDYLAVTSDDLGTKVKVPFVNEDGYWVFFDENGEESVSSYKANGATYAVKANGGFTLFVPDADGTMQTVVLPGEGSAVTGIEILGTLSGSTVGALQPITFHAYKPAATTNWGGNEGNLTGKELLTSFTTDVIVRVTPSNVDVSNLSFKLVNSMGVAAPVDVTLSAWNGNTGSNVPLTRAASANGMYTLNISGKEMAPNMAPATWLNDNVKKIFFAANVPATPGLGYTTADDATITGKHIAYALVEESGMVSPFDITFDWDAADEATPSYAFYDFNTYTWVLSGGELQVGHTYMVYDITFDEFVYDAYLEFTNATTDRWGIQYNKAATPTIFTVTSMPDNVSAAALNVKVNYLTKKGVIGSQTLTATPKTTLTGAVALCSEKSFLRNMNNDFFVVPMDALFQAMGSSKTNEWIEDITTTIAAADFTIKEGTSSKSTTGVTVTYAKNANGDAPANAGEITHLKIAFDHSAGTACELPLDKSYTLTLKSKAKSGVTQYANDVVSTVTVPFKLTKPELNTILVKESGVFTGNVAAAYMYHGDKTTVGATTVNGATYVSNYKISRAFTDMLNKLAAVGMTYTFTLDGDTKIVDDLKSNQLAVVSNASADAAIVLDPTNKVAATGYPKGYNKELIVKFAGSFMGISEDSYQYEEVYKFRIMSPIEQGKLVANNNLVKVSATGKTEINGTNVWAKTFNNDVKFEIFKATSTTYSRNDIASVTFSSTNTNIFEVTSTGGIPENPVAATATTPAKASWIEVEGVAAGTAQLKANIKDIWGYSLIDVVDVEATVAQ